MKRTLIYTRVSTHEQTIGVSLKVQEEACRRFCEANGLEVVRIFSDEGESAKTTCRAAYQEMIAYCSKHEGHIQHVLVHKLDRLARSLADAVDLDRFLSKAGISLLSATECFGSDASGTLFRNMLHVFAQFDNQLRGERSQASMIELANQGFWVHMAPPGYKNARDDIKRPVLIEDPETGPLVRQIFEAVGMQGRNTTEALALATTIGLRQRNGTLLNMQRIYDLLHNPIYCGIVKGKQTNNLPVKARFTPLISVELFERVQAVLAGHGHIATPHVRNNVVFPLRRFVKCGHCGAPLTASYAKGRAGRRYPYYFCQAKGCRKTIVRKEAMEAAFVRLLDDVTLKTNATMRMLREIVTETWHNLQLDTIMEQASLNTQIDAADKKKALLLDKLLAGTVTDAVYKKKVLEIDGELLILKAGRAEAEIEEGRTEAVLDYAGHMFANARRIWEGLTDLNDRQRFQRVLYPDGVSFTNESGYQTPANAPVTRICEVVGAGASVLAPPSGFEPLFPG